MNNEQLKACRDAFEKWHEEDGSYTLNHSIMNRSQVAEYAFEAGYEVALEQSRPAVQGDDSFVDNLIKWLENYWPESEPNKICSPMLMRRVIVAWIRENRPPVKAIRECGI